MAWNSVKLPAGGKLFKVHRFTFLFNGANFLIEIDEYADGACSGHGEHATDKNFVIESVSGSSVEECLNGLISRIQERNPS